MPELANGNSALAFGRLHALRLTMAATIVIRCMRGLHLVWYGLQSQYEHLAKLHPLPAQLKELKRWSTNPIQLNRLLKAHSERTWANTLKYIDLYLGYCRFLGEQQPTLQMFLSPDHICKSVSFKVDSQHSIYTINMFLAAAREVLMWWQQKPGGHHPSLEHAVQWLRNMTKQV